MERHGAASLRLKVICFFLLPWAVTACSDGTGGTRVHGVVTYDGEAVQEGDIRLFPTAGSAGPTMGGAIRHGKFDVPADQGPRAGGTYRVEINGLKKTGEKVKVHYQSDPVEEKANYIPDVYNRASKLQIKVSAKASENKYDFHLAPVPDTSR